MKFDCTGAALDHIMFKTMHPFYWKRRTRRVFLFLLPVSVPVWAFFTTTIIGLRVLLFAVTPIADFWNRPQRYKIRYHYFGYDARPRSRRGWSSGGAALRTTPIAP